MSNWIYLDEPGSRACQVMYRNHYGDHDIGYESVIAPGSVDAFRWIRLNPSEALAFARQLPEVRALVEELQAIREKARWTRGPDAMVALGWIDAACQIALRPFTQTEDHDEPPFSMHDAVPMPDSTPHPTKCPKCGARLMQIEIGHYVSVGCSVCNWVFDNGIKF
jgi:hypothetical protein